MSSSSSPVQPLPPSEPHAAEASPVPAREGGRPIARVTLSAFWQLFALTLRRQLFSRQTLVGIGLTVLCCLIVWAWSRQREPTLAKFSEQVMVPVYVAFLMPVVAICYGASGVGAEREDRTLIYLLITPIPRPLVYFAKFLAANLLVTAWAGVALFFLSRLAGESGGEGGGGGAAVRDALHLFLGPSLLGAAAYASLFLLLGTLFRHGTMISLAYWFFLEVLFGNMPGIVKRVSVAYYVRCMIYEEGAELKLGPVGRVAREMFLPVSSQTAKIVLATSITALLIAGLSVFSKREYRDLS